MCLIRRSGRWAQGFTVLTAELEPARDSTALGFDDFELEVEETPAFSDQLPYQVGRVLKGGHKTTGSIVNEYNT